MYDSRVEDEDFKKVFLSFVAHEKLKGNQSPSIQDVSKSFHVIHIDFKDTLLRLGYESENQFLTKIGYSLQNGKLVDNTSSMMNKHLMKELRNDIIRNNTCQRNYKDDNDDNILQVNRENVQLCKSNEPSQTTKEKCDQQHDETEAALLSIISLWCNNLIHRTPVDDEEIDSFGNIAFAFGSVRDQEVAVSKGYHPSPYCKLTFHGLKMELQFLKKITTDSELKLQVRTYLTKISEDGLDDESDDDSHESLTTKNIESSRSSMINRGIEDDNYDENETAEECLKRYYVPEMLNREGYNRNRRRNAYDHYFCI